MENHEIPVVILAGGKGTRLRGLDSTRPKPLVPVLGKPFLHWLVKNYAEQGFREFVLSTGYLAEQFEAYPWEKEFPKLVIRTHAEKDPLGTGGALLDAFKRLPEYKRAWVVNGDTFLPEPLPEILPDHLTQEHGGSAEEAFFCVLESSGIFDAQPNLVADANRIIGVRPAVDGKHKYFDAGAACVTKTALERFFGVASAANPLSLHQVLAPAMEMRRVGYRILSGTCYDIGTPERFRRFEAYLASAGAVAKG